MTIEIPDDVVERAARAGDREDSAQLGEPCPWTHPDLRGELDPVFVAERMAVYRAALAAAGYGELAAECQGYADNCDRLANALKAIFAVGSGFGPNTEENPQGTTGEGHATCREIARAALTGANP